LKILNIVNLRVVMPYEQELSAGVSVAGVGASVSIGSYSDNNGTGFSLGLTAAAAAAYSGKVSFGYDNKGNFGITKTESIKGIGAVAKFGTVGGTVVGGEKTVNGVPIGYAVIGTVTVTGVTQTVTKEFTPPNTAKVTINIPPAPNILNFYNQNPETDPASPGDNGIGGYDSHTGTTSELGADIDEGDDPDIGGWINTTPGRDVSDSSGGPDSEGISDASLGGWGDGSMFAPLAIDLDGDGVELIDMDASTAFYDLNGDGFRTHLGWVSADDGFLAYDKNTDGIIQDGDEISFVSYVEGAVTDLEGLQYFDSNSDGVLDSSDAEWSKFGVWQDIDQDGETDDGEFQSLGDQGITSITLSSDGIEEDVGSNHIFGTGSYVMAGGASADFADVALETSAIGFNISADGHINIQAEEDSSIYLDGRFSDLDVDLGKFGYIAAFGFDGDDSLSAGSATDVLIEGGDGDDTLTGGTGDDWIAGGAGADSLSAGDGDDILFVDADDTTIDGGDGFDLAFVETADAVTIDLKSKNLEAVFAHDGDDTLTASYTVADETGIYMDGGAGADSLTGGAGDDWLIGGDGSDTLSGGDGDDVLFIDSADTVANISGGAGDDAVFVMDATGVTLDLNAMGVESAYGNDGADTFSTTGSTAVTLSGGGGDDTLTGGSGDDTLAGGAGDDTLTGGTGDDVYNFGYGDGADTIDNTDSGHATATDIVNFTRPVGRFDTLFSKSGDDLITTLTLTGDTLTISGWFSDSARRVDYFVYSGLQNAYAFVGDDTTQSWTAQTDDNYKFVGFGANDSLTGAGGHDILVGGSGGDTLTGGDGSDTVSYEGSSAAVTVSLAANTATGGDAAGDTLTGIENLYGSDHADTLTGDSADNILTGAAGDDTLSGNAGDDTLIGGSGADTITGGDGVDLASYAGSLSGVSIDLLMNTSSGGDAQGDVLTSVENINGSAYDDVLTGDAAANVLSGGSGDDVLTGGEGDDTLTGGAGADTATFEANRASFDVYYDTAADAIMVTDLNAAAFGDEGTDTLRGIETITFNGDGVTLDMTIAPKAQAAIARLETDNVANWKVAATGGEADADGVIALAYALETQASHGTVTIDTHGNYTYTPQASYSGQDSFRFRSTDIGGRASVATISLYVGVSTDELKIDAAFGDNWGEDFYRSFQIANDERPKRLPAERLAA
jgi:Ca2+-binding RTX toxin-like protein